ncbi:PREDICTED: choline transporter-like protein 2 [Tarenaya hassleriana]|uniref:choline transporter-like protein 2 n=1 Tax=Tarenaya hassleriana TaxID=28532 RepID=UPI00053C1BEC|nr:PREDICTED: choline transporter-like protein 2 [Tarenaya hassleriana]
MAAADGDPNKPVSVYDSSSPTHPLLSKPSSSAIDSPGQPDPEPDPTQFLQISYNFGLRPFKDIPFLVLFDLLVASTFGFGIFSIFHRNTDYGNLSSYTYDFSSTSCVKNSTLTGFFGGFWISSIASGRNSSSGAVFEKDLIWTLVVTLILSVPFCFLVLLLLKHYTKQIVYACLPFFVVLPTFFNVYWFVACTVSSSCSDALPLGYRVIVLVFIFLVIGIIVWIFVANWHRIELTIQVIGVASDALSKNLGLFLVLPLLTLGLVLYYAPIVVFLLFSRFNGKVVPKESNGEYLCVWKQDGWVPAYFALAIITMLWSLAVMVEMQVYVISGTISQWYFSMEDSTLRKSIRSSLRNAFGPSFGTVCLSGILICIVRVVRAIAENARQENPQGMINMLLRCCANTLVSAVDYLNKFTINFAAITGEAYCTSAKLTYELLRRNLLSAVFVETVSTRLLAGIIFVLSAVYAVAAWGILKGVSDLDEVDSYLVAAVAWFLLIVVLGFFVHVMDNVIDTIYVCYAMDRDRGDVCKQEVHEVYVHLPISRSARYGFIIPQTPNV